MTCATPPQTLSRLTSGRWTVAHCTVLRDWRPNGNWTTSHVTVHRRVSAVQDCVSRTPVACFNSIATYLSADIQLVSQHGRHHLRSSSYRTLAVPRTRGVIWLRWRGLRTPAPNDCKMKLFAQLQKLKTANQLWIVEITWFFKPGKNASKSHFPIASAASHVPAQVSSEIKFELASNELHLA